MPQQTIFVQQDGTRVYTGSPSSHPKLVYTSSPTSPGSFQAAVCVPQMPGTYAPALQPVFNAVDKPAAATGSPARLFAPAATNAGSPILSPVSAARVQRGTAARPSPPGQEWTVTPMSRPMKEGATKLGVECRSAAGAAGSELVVVKIMEGGRLDAWNRARPDQAVKPGDRIVQVNGRRGSSETLMSILRSEDQLQFVVRRGGAGTAKPDLVEQGLGAKKQGGQDCLACHDGPLGLLRGLFEGRR